MPKIKELSHFKFSSDVVDTSYTTVEASSNWFVEMNYTGGYSASTITFGAGTGLLASIPITAQGSGKLVGMLKPRFKYYGGGVADITVNVCTGGINSRTVIATGVVSGFNNTDTTGAEATVYLDKPFYAGVGTTSYWIEVYSQNAGSNVYGWHYGPSTGSLYNGTPLGTYNTYGTQSMVISFYSLEYSPIGAGVKQSQGIVPVGPTLSKVSLRMRKRFDQSFTMATRGSAPSVSSYNAFGSTTKAAQAFTANTWLSGDKLDVFLRTDTTGTSADIQVRLETASGSPLDATGTLVHPNAAGTITSFTDSTGTWRTATFTNPWYIPAGTNFCVVLSSTGASTTTRYRWGYEGAASGPYITPTGTARVYAGSWANGTNNGATQFYHEVSNPSFSFRLETDNAGKPSGTLVNASAVGTISRTPLTGEIRDYDVTFPAIIPVTPASTYHLVADIPGAKFLEYEWIGDGSGSTYPNGANNTYDGTTWTTNSGKDLYFKAIREGSKQFGNSTWYSEKFTYPTTAYQNKIRHLSFLLKGVGSGATINVKLHADNAGNPGTLLGSTTIAGFTSSSFLRKVANFSADIPVTLGSVYHAVINASGAASTAEYFIRAELGDGSLASASSLVSTNSGSSWTVEANDDLAIGVYSHSMLSFGPDKENQYPLVRYGETRNLFFPTESGRFVTPKPKINSIAAPFRDGETPIAKALDVKMLNLSNLCIEAATREDLVLFYDEVLKNTQHFPGYLGIDLSENTARYYVATREDFAAPTDHYHTNIITGANLSFQCWSATSEEEEAVEVSEPVSSLLHTATVTMGGSYKAYPTIRLDLTAVSATAQKLDLTNPTTGQTLLVDKGSTFASGDSIVVDSESQVVTVNNTVVDYTGLLPSLAVGENKLNFSFLNSGGYALDRSTLGNTYYAIGYGKTKTTTFSITGTSSLIYAEIFCHRFLESNTTIAFDILDLSGNLITNGRVTKLTDLIGTGNHWERFTFSTPPTLTTGVTYQAKLYISVEYPGYPTNWVGFYPQNGYLNWAGASSSGNPPMLRLYTQSVGSVDFVEYDLQILCPNRYE